MKTNTTRQPKRMAYALLVALAIILSACGGDGGISMSYSPEQVAVQEVMKQSGGRNGQQIDPTSVQVLQSTVVGAQTFVLVSYEGVRGDLGGAKMTCLSLYGLRKGFLGMFLPGSGNGSCESKINVAGESNAPEPTPQPISIGGGRTGGDGRNDPGYSMTSGKVTDAAIKAVRVTWLDGTDQQVDVINASYVAARTGQVEMMKVEALNEKGDVVFTWQPEVAPGKK